MSFEEEFDSIMRRKSEELDYPFDEKNWEKAGAMLDAERQAAMPVRSRRLWVPALMAAVVVISGSALLLNDWNHTSSKAKPSTSQTSDLNTADQKIASLSSSTTHHENERTVSSQILAEQQLVSSRESKTPDYTANAKHISEGSENNDHVTRAAAILPLKEKLHNAAFANNQKLLMEQSLSSSSENNSQSANSNSSEKENQDVHNHSSSNNIMSNEQTVAFASEESLKEIAHLPLIPAQQSSLLQNDIILTPLNYINRYDEDYFKGNKRTKINFFNIELGGTYLLGWNTAAGKDGKGLDWFAGINYGVYLTRKFNVSVGLQAYNIKNITQAFYNNQKVEYDFGAITTNTVITSNNLYYASVPLKFSYEVNRTSQFGLGANFGYLINSKNTIETYEVQDNSTIHYKPVKNTGVYQAANSMNIVLGASYRAEIIPRLYLNTELLYGVSDIFKNTAVNKTNENTMGLRLSLQYTLFDK